MDDASRDYLLAHIEDVPDALTRGAAWITMWDNVLEHRIAQLEERLGVTLARVEAAL